MTPILRADSLSEDIHALEKQLSQKKFFENSLKEIVRIVYVAYTNESFVEVSSTTEQYFRRMRTMLRSRYTNLAFWRAAEDACRACKVCICEFKAYIGGIDIKTRIINGSFSGSHQGQWAQQIAR